MSHSLDSVALSLLLRLKVKTKRREMENYRAPITNGHLLFVMGALILQRAQKCEVRQVTKDVVKSEI